jgi:hypothetical protein
MTRSAVFTMHCPGTRNETCPETVTAASEKELLKLAEDQGWHVDYGTQVFGGYDACPKHWHLMDRIDWSSCS